VDGRRCNHAGLPSSTVDGNGLTEEVPRQAVLAERLNAKVTVIGETGHHEAGLVQPSNDEGMRGALPEGDMGGTGVVDHGAWTEEPADRLSDGRLISCNAGVVGETA